MNNYMRNQMNGAFLRRTITLMATSAMVFSLAVCSPTEFLAVQDPDIINPEDVESAAGANAVRLGALARLNTATSGGESLFLLGGLFADEWVNGDSFIARQEIDQRVITLQNTFLTTANRALHRARVAGTQAVQLLEEFSPNAPGWQPAEMELVQAYVLSLISEHYCDGVVLSRVIDGQEEYGTPTTTAAALELALGHATAGLAHITGSTANDLRVRDALQIVRGRILLDLNRPADAATSVTGVSTAYRYNVQHSATTTSNNLWSFNASSWRYSVGNNEGTNGLNFATAGDPRLPVCVGGTTGCISRALRDDQSSPLHVQTVWTARETPVAIISGIEARLIEAEAQLRAGNAEGALATLNAARTTVTGLAPLTDAVTDAARVDQLFRERAFWLFGRGHRTGDLRRLIRQYNRPANTVFPTGTWHKGGNYGTDVTIPVPQAELNNPNLPAGQTCINRNA
jgi:SusD/RagB-like outer membrane lipoprotein